MNAHALNHPKTLDLAASIETHLAAQGAPLPPGLGRTVAVGLLEQLWLFTVEYAPAGDVGRFPDKKIARALGWSGDAEWLIGTLVELQWLDRDDEHRLVVHQWSQHCAPVCDQTLADAGEVFADGTSVKRRPRRNTRGYRLAHPDGPPPPRARRSRSSTKQPPEREPGEGYLRTPRTLTEAHLLRRQLVLRDLQAREMREYGEIRTKTDPQGPNLYDGAIPQFAVAASD